MKKFISLLVVAAFALTLVPVAKADTISDLMAQIAALQAQIAALSGATSTTTCFSANLKLGMRTNDVKLLQEKLGVSNTGYFGPLTLAAVKKFQGDNGVPTTGFVGEMTRAKLNEKFCVVSTTPTTVPGTTLPAGCTSSVGFSPTTGVSCATGTVASTTTEGSLTLVSAPVSIDSTIKGGESGKTIYAVGVKAKNSDITVKRFDVDMNSTASLIPWKYFSKISLYKDGSLVQSIDVTNTSLNEVVYADEYIARFDGINAVVAKDTTANFSVKVDLLSTLPDTSAHYVAVGANTANAIRGVDGLGLNQYVSSSTYDRTITINGSTTGTFTLTANVNTPKAANIISDVNNSKSDIDALMFDIKPAGADITIKGITAGVITKAGIISGISLYDGSTKIASVGLPSTATSTTVQFTNLSIAATKDVVKTLDLKFDLVANATSTANAIQLTVGNSGITANDVNDNIATGTGAANGNLFTVLASGPSFTFVSASNTVTPASSSGTAYATGIITFKMKANGADIAKLTNASNVVAVLDASNATLADASVNVVTTPDNATITDGSEATVTVTAVQTAGATGKFVSFSIGQIVAGGTTTTGGTGTVLESFKTPTVWLAN